MLGIEKYVLELRNSLMVLREAVGLQKNQRPQKEAEDPSSRLQELDFLAQCAKIF